MVADSLTRRCMDEIRCCPIWSGPKSGPTVSPRVCPLLTTIIKTTKLLLLISWIMSAHDLVLPLALSIEYLFSFFFRDPCSYVGPVRRARFHSAFKFQGGKPSCLRKHTKCQCLKNKLSNFTAAVTLRQALWSVSFSKIIPCPRAWFQLSATAVVASRRHS